MAGSRGESDRLREAVGLARIRVASAREDLDAAERLLEAVDGRLRASPGDANGFLLRVKSAKARAVLAAVSDALDVPPRRMDGNSKEADAVLARATAAWVLRQAGASFVEIGRLLRRHHSTVMSGIRRIEARRKADERFAEVSNELAERFAQPEGKEKEEAR